MAGKEILLHDSCQMHQINDDFYEDSRAKKREENAGLMSHYQARRVLDTTPRSQVRLRKIVANNDINKNKCSHYSIKK